ncbi:MAG: hypothetical protein Q8S73_13275 [Deltaproteobacteria bacterium]|nr:hypothetical protein [Myxococcales bacterium]MDP3215072.1 hypothetical protein [Deltaproteobacteria bacterium]
MSAELTVRQKILMAAVAMGSDTENFSVEDLIVRSWKMFPESFSLRGFERLYPDSNRVLAKLSGADGLCGLGWLEHTDQRTYRLSRKGRTVARTLATIQDNVGVEAPAAEVTEEQVVEEKVERPAPLRVASEPAAKPAPVKAERPAPVRAAKPVREVKPAAVSESRPMTSTATLTAMDVNALQQIGKADALRKFLRGQPLSFSDACAFWGFSSASRAAVVQQRLDMTTDLLKRAVESFSNGVDARIPPLSTCYGLFNLNRLMAEKFARELEGLRLPVAAGG